MTAHRVTVPGEPVEAEVSWEQVLEYLTKTRWVRGYNHSWSRDGVTVWFYYFQGSTWRCTRNAVMSLAHIEQREPAAVLRDIARVGQGPSADAKPLTEKELAAIEARTRLATAEPGEERECARCETTMGASDCADEASTFCDSCAHHAAAELAADAGRLHGLAGAEMNIYVSSQARTIEQLRTREQELAAVRIAVGAREDETTVDAARRVAAERDAWREVTEAEDEDAARFYTKTSVRDRVRAARAQLVKLRLVPDPDADP